MLITITNNGQPNGRPTTIGVNEITTANSVNHVFTLANFTTETTPAYSDPEGDELSYVKIKTMQMTESSLQLNGVEVIEDDLITSGDISSGNFLFVQSNQHSGLESLSQFEFDIADSGSNSLSGLSTGLFKINVSKEVNEPASSVGSKTISTDHASSYTFTKENFTTETSPPYLDPEGDDADKLKILSLPFSGSLKYNNVAVNINQIIPFTEINSGYLTYVADPTIDTFQSLTFNFAIADSGSGIFVEN